MFKPKKEKLLEEIISSKFCDIPGIKGSFEQAVLKGIDYAKGLGIDENVADVKRFFTLKLSSNPVVETVKSYSYDSKVALEMFEDIAAYCIQNTSKTDIFTMATDDSHMGRLLLAVKNLKNPEVAHDMLGIVLRRDSNK